MVAKADTSKSVKVRYFALLKEERGLSEETLETEADTLRDLYQELKARHHFALGVEQLRVAVGDDFVDFDGKIQDKSVIIFVPPVAGG